MFVHGRALRLAVSVGAVAVATLTVAPPRLEASVPLPGATWLESMNLYRAESGLGPVSEDAAWTAGMDQHIQYLDHTDASLRTGMYASAHTENPSSSWYTPDGAAAAGSSNIGFGATEREAIDHWMAAPFHAIGILRPNLTRSAFALHDTAMLDVIRGLEPALDPRPTVLFPGANSTTYLTAFESESPDPRDGCGGGGQSFNGLPIFALLPGRPLDGTTAILTAPDGTVVREGRDLCVQTGATYRSADPVYGATGESILDSDNAVMVIPRETLDLGVYTVEVLQPGDAAVRWSFKVVRSPEPPLHVQVAGAPLCRGNSSSSAWLSTVGLPSRLVGAYQIGDTADQETYVVGGDGNVYHNYLDTRHTWAGWSSLSGPPGGIYGTVRTGNNHLGQQELYVRGNDGQVYHLYATSAHSGWHGWDAIGAPSPGISGDVYEGTNYLHDQELFVLGADGSVYHKFSTPGIGTGWSNWDSLGHPNGVVVTGDVQLGANFLCNQEIYITGTDGNTYHSYATPGQGSGWSAWSSLGQPVAGAKGSVTVGQNAENNQELFLVGADDAVYHNFSTPGRGSGWSGWSSLGAPGGTITDTTVFVDTFPVEKLTVTTSETQAVNCATPGQGSGWSGW